VLITESPEGGGYLFDSDYCSLTIDLVADRQRIDTRAKLVSPKHQLTNRFFLITQPCGLSFRGASARPPPSPRATRRYLRYL